MDGSLPPGIVSAKTAVVAMAKINYDAEHVGKRPRRVVRRGSKPTLVEPGGFADRVSSRRRDLVKLIREGVPEVEYLPECDGMLVRGKRHQLVAPQKSGKSMAMLVHAVRMVLKGVTVIVFDRENGQHEYARRLGAIFDAWKLSEHQQRRVRQRLVYVEFPKLREADRDEFGEWAAALGAELVIFDAQRLFLTDLDLAEDDSDDYARFIVAVVEPLTEREVATLILDNTGHENGTRGRGSSSKGDLNEVLFVLETAEPFSRATEGRLVLKLEPGRSRFGNEGEWSMRIGGGKFGEWTRLPAVSERIKTRAAPDADVRRLVIDHVRREPGISRTRTIKELKGKGAGDQKLRDAINALVREGAVVEATEGLHVP